MENDSQKWVTGSFAAASVLLFFILLKAGQHMAGVWDLETKVRSIQTIITMGSMAIAAIMFGVLWFNDAANQYINEVVVELSRVTWPSTLETRNATFIVIIMVLIAGTVLWFFDALWIRVIQFIL